MCISLAVATDSHRGYPIYPQVLNLHIIMSYGLEPLVVGRLGFPNTCRALWVGSHENQGRQSEWFHMAANARVSCRELKRSRKVLRILDDFGLFLRPFIPGNSWSPNPRNVHGLYMILPQKRSGKVPWPMSSCWWITESSQWVIKRPGEFLPVNSEYSPRHLWKLGLVLDLYTFSWFV